MDLTNRQDPLNDVERSTKDAWLDAFRNLLTEDWLNLQGPHPLRQLWKRKDFLATIELLTIGHGLVQVLPKYSPKLKARLVKDLRSFEAGTRSGTLFELLASSMFANDQQTVTMPADGQPGYDFSIKTGGGHVIRVSCKRLLVSQEERAFVAAAEAMRQAVAERGDNPTLAFAQMEDVTAADRYNVGAVRKAMRDFLAGASGRRNLSTTFHGWRVFINPLAAAVPHAFARTRQSYTFGATAPFGLHEQKRIEDKIDDAIANLRKHVPLGDGNANVVLIQPPQSVSVVNAAAYATDYFADPQRAAAISGVFVYRPAVVRDVERDETFIAHHHRYIENPHATTRLGERVPPGGLSIQVPIGRVTDVEPELQLHMGEHVVRMGGQYVFYRGEHWYDVDARGSHTEFAMPRLAGLRMHFILHGLAQGSGDAAGLPAIAGISPDEDELTVL